MRVSLAVLTLGAMLSACGSGRDTQSNATPSSAPAAASRIDRCVDRLLRHATVQNEATRRYARNTYCARFEQNGWIYEDGAVSIAAQAWLDKGATCARSSEGQPARTVPCKVDRTALDCALLRIVRRSQVRKYIHRLETNGAVRCDDGTALDKLGVP